MRIFWHRVFFVLTKIGYYLIGNSNSMRTEVYELPFHMRGLNRRMWTYNPNFGFGLKLLAITYHCQSIDLSISLKERKKAKKLMIDEFGSWRGKFYINYYEPTKIMDKISFNSAVSDLLIDANSKSKIQILNYVITIFTDDKYLSAKELGVLNKLKSKLKLHNRTFEAVLAMHNYTTEEEVKQQKEQAKVKRYHTTSLVRYYKILELDEGVTLNEVKEAYRRLVKLYHPDKLVKKNNQERHIAKEKLQLIQEAYDKIKEKLNG